MANYKWLAGIPTIALGSFVGMQAMSDNVADANETDVAEKDYTVWEATPVEDINLKMDGMNNYKVVWGDTLYNIAMKANIGVDDIMQVNQDRIQDADVIYDGQSIKIPIDKYNEGKTYVAEPSKDVDYDQSSHNGTDNSSTKSDDKSDNQSSDKSNDKSDDKSDDDVKTNIDDSSKDMNKDGTNKKPKTDIDMLDINDNGEFVDVTHMTRFDEGDEYLEIKFKHPSLFNGLKVHVDSSRDKVYISSNDAEKLNKRIEAFNKGEYKAPKDNKGKVTQHTIDKAVPAPTEDGTVFKAKEVKDK